MSKRPVDIAHLKNLQRKRRALQSREAKEQREDKKNAVRQTTIDIFARPSDNRQGEANRQMTPEEDNPFRLSSQTNAQVHNPFACSSQPDLSSQSSFSLLESLSQPEPLAGYYSEEESDRTEDEEQQTEALYEPTDPESVAPPDLMGSTSIIIKQKKNDMEDHESSENRLVINLASQDDYKTLLGEDMSDDTESVDSDTVRDRADHDDYDISDEVFRFSRTSLSNTLRNEEDEEDSVSDFPLSDSMANSEMDTNAGKLLSILKQKTDSNVSTMSGAFDIEKTNSRTSTGVNVSADSENTEPYAPFDWSLKTSVSISSTQDFDWIESDALSRAKALSQFRSSNLADQTLLNYCTSNDLSYHGDYSVNQCLFHWAYPNAPPSADEIAANNRMLSKSVYTDEDKPALQKWQDVENEWTSSFLSLYDLLCIDECDYFYYIGSTICVLFRSKKFAQGGEMEAIGSRSTIAFRRHLDTAETYQILQGVTYSMPYKTNDKENVTMSKEVLSELEYLEAINPGSTRQAKTATAHIDNGRGSFFRVQGVQAVKELMEALITWKEPRTSDRAHGPPTLISPQCFLNSTLKCAEYTG
ncbi:hypothetical protein Unana1_07809 [Umbelopsis nana]